MRKIIWTCWLQGRHNAPFVVQKCLDSWQAQNPTWEFRCLDAHSIRHYIDFDEHIDLQKQSITAASLSDIVRILLLHEYGGVWVDATLFCNQPLDSWLPHSLNAGFFAFCNPAPDRMLSSWFLAAAPGNPLITAWARSTIQYWSGRERTNDYFWFHHLFGDLYAADTDVRRIWNAVPRVSADGPHALQAQGVLDRPGRWEDAGVDTTEPVFKLTHRLSDNVLRPGTAVHDLLSRQAPGPVSPPRPTVEQPMQYAGLRTKTENLGDHIQILAAERLLKRFGIEISSRIDRDDEISSADLPANTGILLNGWYKTNPSEWPPNPNLIPIYLGFHIRLFQSPTLVSDAALQNYRDYGPVGCRDNYTLSLLRARGVDAFLSNCLTLSLPRRLTPPEAQKEIFVVSRDDRILERLPDALGDVTFVSHYTGTSDFAENMASASELLRTYRDRAKLVVTTLLHCALPAIALGIPVVIFYPENPEQQHKSDRERFSTLERMVRVYSFSEIDAVDWGGQVVDAGSWKLGLIDALSQTTERWNVGETVVGPVAPSETLPVPTQEEIIRVMTQRAMDARKPDRARWGDPASYKPDWAGRAALAAALLPDGARLLEIGTGAGAFRRLVEGRCHYTGADLQPLSADLLPLDLDSDDLPLGFDYAVTLGVLEYLHHPHDAVAKLCRSGTHLVVTYCALRPSASPEMRAARKARGWVNAFQADEFIGLFTEQGCKLVERTLVNQADDFEQFLMKFSPA